ncbi:MAG: GNAT family N-acetyltransferase, partial [Chloroflexi bacterium]|nr:GNAT family N-acetyltransferase [Chloroflexota bacterium]
DTSNLKNYKTVVILKDGTTLTLRAIQTEDLDKLISLFKRLGPRTVYLRFRQNMTQISREEARQPCTIDYDNTFALIATTGEGDNEKFIAVGRYARLPKADRATAALVVEDAYQRRGVGTSIIEKITAIAREKDIRYFDAGTLTESAEAMKVLEDAGFKKTEEAEHGVLRMVLDLSPNQIAEEKASQREEVATIASLHAFLKPKTVAVIGASHRPEGLGYRVFDALLNQKFNGTVYPVNPNAVSVASVKAYPSILDVPGEVDLAVVVIPAEYVQQVAEQCGHKGVRGIVVITSGFGEAGFDGEKMQENLLNTVRSYGMRMVGPNCMGILNTAPDVSMNASFSPIFPPTGNIAFGTQSGGLGLAILEYARTLNVGLSTFVSFGNKADVSANDLLQYWKEDPMTDVILLYMESFGNPRKFAKIARDVTRHKPIIVVKSGRTAAGARAAASHTGAMASTEVATEALFTQAGITRVDTLEELFDTANLFAHQPIPKGRKVAILTNGGGPGILTADACADRGLEITMLSEKTKLGLKSFLPPQASVNNPVDMTAESGGPEYHRALRLLAQDENIDIAIAILVSPVATRTEDVAKAIRDISPEFHQMGKTLLVSFMGQRGVSAELSGGEFDVPSYSFPEATAIAIAKACEYSDWLKRPKGSIPHIAGIDKKKALATINSILQKATKQPVRIDGDSIIELLNCYGINSIPSKVATTADEAIRIAEEIGFPVAIKLYSKTIAHKTDVGGVSLDLRSASEVRQAFDQIKDRLSDIGRLKEMQGVVVQPMITDGIETIVGVTQDPSFGPLILFGLGGIYTELFKDVTFRIHPLTDIDAREMVRSVKTYHLLEGWRGAKPSDIKAIEELLLRVSAMVEDLPQIAEIDLNPVKVLEQGKGCVTVDARILLS